MKCEDLLGALNDYVDANTQSALCRELQEHLVNCSPCRVVIDNIRQTITLYRAGQAATLPTGLHERIRTILQMRWAALPRLAGRCR